MAKTVAVLPMIPPIAVTRLAMLEIDQLKRAGGENVMRCVDVRAGIWMHYWQWHREAEINAVLRYGPRCLAYAIAGESMP